MDREHEHDPEAQAAWALAATSAAAGRALTTLNGCAACAAEAAMLRGAVDWLGTAQPVRPPARLRDAVLAAARAARVGGRKGSAGSPQALAYATQVAALDALLGGLSPRDWRAAVPRHGNVRALIAHLSANDQMVAADLGLVRPADDNRPDRPDRPDRHDRHDQHVRRVWRERAAMVLERVPADPADRLDRPVRLAGRHQAVRPLRDGLVQRAFETWIHADDVRAVLDLPSRPPPAEHVRLIAELGVRLLPTALAAAAAGGADRPVRLILHGAGGGTWELPPGRDPAVPPEVTITCDVVEFCRLLAGRRAPEEFVAIADGDPDSTLTVLRAIASLGCGD
ncbi:MAG TPA: maleylpyruvate isomerase family mycothiol-dependent enzyme [Streptosporangiaceae bacterium]|nr:maleylpyruvate isomerase family mycothiol-dependent enzyme [Streptosporangiaceae bacterium]